MAEKIKATKNKKLRNKFRFVVLNDETFEEKFSLSLSRANAWIFAGTIAFTLIFLTSTAIIYTPLKYFIPGFGDYNYRSRILQLQFQTDSLSEAFSDRKLWLENLMNVMEGKTDTSEPDMIQPGNLDKSKIKLNEESEASASLRREMEKEESYNLTGQGGKGSNMVEEVKQMHPMVPVEGYITDDYNAEKEHYGIDIAAKQDAPVKAVLNGKIVSATYTLETGYVITVQHSGNLVSIYKHNARLFKKQGEAVKAGDVIALAGNTGENSTGPHLHFEMWHEGRSLNPRDYILF